MLLENYYYSKYGARAAAAAAAVKTGTVLPTHDANMEVCADAWKTERLPRTRKGHE